MPNNKYITVDQTTNIMNTLANKADNRFKLNTLTGLLTGGELSEEEDTEAVSISTLPYAFYEGAAVIYNNEIHILGAGSYPNYINHYKWNGSSWNIVSTLPYPFFECAAVVYNNEIHILGGSAERTKHYKYNGSSWKTVSTLPYDFYEGAAVVYNNEIHILGSGASGNYTKHYKWNGSSWTLVSTLPYEFQRSSAVVYNNEIHILGSSNNQTNHYKYNGSSWTSVSTLPYNFYQGSAVIYNNEIHILGTYTSSDRTKHYKYNGSSWSEVSTLPYNFYQGSAVIYNDEIHILGGSDNQTDHYRVEKLTPVSGWTPVYDQQDPTKLLFYTQTITVTGLSKDDIITVGFDISQMAIADIPVVAKSQIYCVGQDDDELDFMAYKLPTCDIPIILTKQGGITTIVNIPTVIIGEHTYDGTEQSVTISSYDPDEITVTGNTGTNVGNYECVLTLKPNMIWSDGTVAPKRYPWSIEQPSIEMVSFSEGTDSQIKAMIDAYYDGILTLDEIKSVWSVGDSRTITLSAMSATGVGESHRSQSIEMVILDFNHDTLTTPINGKTKALISVQMKNCLRDANVTDTTGSSNTEHGYMNSSDTNVGGWTSSARRTWCNNVFYAALPSGFKTLVKQVNKLTSAGNQSATINTDADYCWLPSEIEIFGTVTYSKSGEGTQYSYYTTAANRYKLPKWSSYGVSDIWWERSPYGSDATGFCYVTGGGNASRNNASNARGLAPACCL